MVVFASFIVIGCISDKMIYGAFIWLLITLIFIPKIKKVLCTKYNFINKYIIPIRIVLVILGIFAFSTLSNQFEGNWVNDNGEKITLDSTYLKYKDSENQQIESTYSYESVSNSDYDDLYDIKVKYKNENVTFRYFKKNYEETLCIYKNNECVENFKKQIEEN